MIEALYFLGGLAVGLAIAYFIWRGWKNHAKGWEIIAEDMAVALTECGISSIYSTSHGARPTLELGRMVVDPASKEATDA